MSPSYTHKLLNTPELAESAMTYISESSLPSQAGRVFIVTGGSSGCGLELVKCLYSLNGTVYILSRSETKALAVIDEMRSSIPSSTGALHFLPLNLADLTTVKTTAERFLSASSRLDIIWHNAGVMVPPDGSVTAQDYELQMGVNALGPFLLQQFLTPLMVRTAALPDMVPYSVRVIWLSSNAHSGGPQPDGVDWDNLNLTQAGTGFAARLRKYSQSKAMNNMYAHEFAARYGGDESKLASLSVHPGRLSTDLQRDLPWYINTIFRFGRKHPRYGGLVELYAGFCNVDETLNGGYVVPEGRFEETAAHVRSGLKERKTGERLWDVSQDKVSAYT